MQLKKNIENADRTADQIMELLEESLAEGTSKVPDHVLKLAKSFVDQEHVIGKVDNLFERLNLPTSKMKLTNHYVSGNSDITGVYHYGYGNATIVLPSNLILAYRFYKVLGRYSFKDFLEYQFADTIIHEMQHGVLAKMRPPANANEVWQFVYQDSYAAEFYVALFAPFALNLYARQYNPALEEMSLHVIEAVLKMLAKSLALDYNKELLLYGMYYAESLIRLEAAKSFYSKEELGTYIARRAISAEALNEAKGLSIAQKELEAKIEKGGISAAIDCGCADRAAKIFLSIVQGEISEASRLKEDTKKALR